MAAVMVKSIILRPGFSLFLILAASTHAAVIRSEVDAVESMPVRHAALRNVARKTNASSSPEESSVPLCGNFCGPGWCGGQRTDEGQCDFNITSRDCADECCKQHDQCCGEDATRVSCNTRMANCLLSCDSLPQGKTAGCSQDDAALMAAGMAILSDSCCGHACNT